MHESQTTPRRPGEIIRRNSFITLTYDDKNLPPHNSLVLAHWQNFAKKFRRDIGPFRFFHCGEYGQKYTETVPHGRPHYHAIIYGHDFSEDRKFYKRNRQGDKLYVSKALGSIWTKGIHAIGDVTFDSCAYVARYILKKQTGKNAIPAYQFKVDLGTGEFLGYLRKPEYCSMSRRPGLGTAWFNKYHGETYDHDQVLSNGKRAQPPKFYDRLLEVHNPRLHRKIKVDRVTNAIPYEHDNTWDRLKTREIVAAARSAHYSRELC